MKKDPKWLLLYIPAIALIVLGVIFRDAGYGYLLFFGVTLFVTLTGMFGMLFCKMPCPKCDGAIDIISFVVFKEPYKKCTFCGNIIDNPYLDKSE